MKIKIYHNAITEMEVDDKFNELTNIPLTEKAYSNQVALSKELMDTIASELNTTYSDIIYVEDLATEYPLYEDQVGGAAPAAGHRAAPEFHYIILSDFCQALFTMHFVQTHSRNFVQLVY